MLRLVLPMSHSDVVPGGIMSPSSGQSVNSSLPGSLDESPMKSKQNIQADPKVGELGVGYVKGGVPIFGGKYVEIFFRWRSKVWCVEVFLSFFLWVGDGPYLKVKLIVLFVKKKPPMTWPDARPSLLTFLQMQWGSTDKCSICTRMGRDDGALGVEFGERIRNVERFSSMSHNSFYMRSNRKEGFFSLIPVFSKRWQQQKGRLCFTSFYIYIMSSENHF